MAWFNFGKKKGKIEATKEVVKETSASLGVFDFFALGKSDQLLILGRLKGSLKLGDRLPETEVPPAVQHTAYDSRRTGLFQ